MFLSSLLFQTSCDDEQPADRRWKIIRHDQPAQNSKPLLLTTSGTGAFSLATKRGHCQDVEAAFLSGSWTMAPRGEFARWSSCPTPIELKVALALRLFM